jgi:hypothetical protein
VPKRTNQTFIFDFNLIASTLLLLLCLEHSLSYRR